MLSIPFLIATFLVYAFIPELRNLHGMCLMAYCGGLIVAYAFLAYLKLHTGKIGVEMAGCYTTGRWPFGVVCNLLFSYCFLKEIMRRDVQAVRLVYDTPAHYYHITSLCTVITLATLPF